jgi:adrenodoxin-NADP+ reductase
MQRRFASRTSLSLRSLPLKLAIVGSGPSGFYAASRIFSLPGSENVRVDMFEELPAPFGLVRYGVAPDHPEVKVRLLILFASSFL